MKFTKRILAVCMVALLGMVLAPCAHAQRSGLTTLLASNVWAPTLTTNTFIVNSGGATNQYGGAATLTNIYSTNIIQSCGDYDYVGLTWQITGVTATTNGTVVLRAFKSFDNGLTYEQIPSFTFTVTTPTATTGATTYLTATNLDVHGVTHLAFTRVNLASSYITNELLEMNFKISKVATVSGTR